ncbi:DNA polymerase [Marmoricola endophyticus]|uniref:DNA polymerase n=1 Tax=Marmoricola endophyticus TaxID=2040280 RepID=A0A917BFI8_9ACTN|nr:DNA polymerase [Marmoricola endophyticus]
MVWCPDWSVVAALEEAALPALTPAAVLRAGVVQVCNAAAREEGVRRGQRRRDAQFRCPDLALLPDNPERDARSFEPVLEAVEELSPGVAALRPGLVAVRAPDRYYGSETNAAAVVAETLVRAGVWDCRLGVADDLFTAEQAARTAAVQDCAVVDPGGAPGFLAGLPVEVLEADGPQGRGCVDLLRRLGLRTLGDLAALPADAVQHRFGRYGTDVRRRARGETPAYVTPRTPPPDLDAEVAFEPPLDSVETICLSARRTAEQLVAALAERQLVVTGVRIEAESDGTLCSARTWLHPRFFSARDVLDRVRWQLPGAVHAPVERVRFVPEVVEPAADHAEGLWGGTGEEMVARGVARVQAMIGFDAVTRPVLQGGRGPADRQQAVPWGERPTGLRPVDRPWPGQVPGPAPACVFADPPASEVCDAEGRVVAVTERGAVTGEPSRFRLDGTWQPVAAWAGPWPVDESWWTGGTGRGQGRCSRFQLVGVDGRAWLLRCGPSGWSLEAGYD